MCVQTASVFLHAVPDGFTDTPPAKSGHTTIAVKLARQNYLCTNSKMLDRITLLQSINQLFGGKDFKFLIRPQLTSASKRD